MQHQASAAARYDMIQPLEATQALIKDIRSRLYIYIPQVVVGTDKNSLQLARPVSPGTVGAGDSTALPVVVLMSFVGGEAGGVLGVGGAGAGTPITAGTSWTGLGDGVGGGVGVDAGVDAGVGVGVALRGRQLLRAWPPA
jgi:hypothetical protein